MMQRRFLLPKLLLPLCLGMIACASVADQANQLTPRERDQGFQLLFNGRDFSGWRNEGNWRIREGAITCVELGANLVCEVVSIRGRFFELRFEWKVIREGNELARETPRFAHPDGSFIAEPRVPRSEIDAYGRVRKWGQLAFLYPTAGGAVGLFSLEVPVLPGYAEAVPSFSRGPKKGAMRPVGQWNRSQIIWRGKTFEHWLNGEKVVETELDLPKGVPAEARRTIEKLKALAAEAWKGGLQVQIEDCDSPLYYRGIKLRLQQEEGAERKKGDRRKAPVKTGME